MMLIYESKQTNNETHIESRAYLDIKSGILTFYKYTFKHNNIINTNCVEVTLKQFSLIAKSLLKSYILMK